MCQPNYHHCGVPLKNNIKCYIAAVKLPVVQLLIALPSNIKYLYFRHGSDSTAIPSPSFQVDNSSLTGETEPQPRGVEATSNNVMETQNVAFYSSSVMEGTCKAVVFETGDRTVIGRLATLTVGKLPFTITYL